jgi:hypothetical protein
MTITREGLALWCVLAGGFFNFVSRITNISLGNYQKFSLQKSMIKKLYSISGGNPRDDISYEGLNQDQSDLKS